MNACVAVCMAHAAAPADLLTFKTAARDISQWLVSVRRDLHQIPELLFQEHKTSARLREYLLELDIPVQSPYAKTGLVGRIGKGKPVVALRADMDALPVLEPPGVDYRSQHEGRMHACGHDGKLWALQKQQY
jgi:IAA-amino acid hydrolase